MASQNDDRFESLLSNILRTVNDSLPKKVVKYRDIVEKGVEGVETVGGWLHRFDRQDIEKIAKQLPQSILDRLHLPFVLVKSIEMEESVYILRVYGSEAEAFQMLMGLETLPRTSRGPYTYKPFVAEFINRYPSLAVLGFL